MRLRLPVGVLAMFAAMHGAAETYYVRADGGNASQCTGRSDAAYAGRGEHAACAWQHPFTALPPGGTPRIAGGDTLVIGAGSYRMGQGAPETEQNSVCRDAPWDCHAAAPPSGSRERPTRIVGAGYDSGCRRAPELWGTQHAATVLDLRGSSNIEIACLEITDHSSCIEFHNGTPGERCEREHAPYGQWASVGVLAADSANVTLRDVDIHGLAHDGVRAGRLRDWTLQRVHIVGNGWAGWNGDLGEDSSNRGKLVFRDVEIAWNGCAERFPDRRHFGCWGQERGGYGDGLGTGATGGAWLFERVDVHHNTQDGLDLLHADAQATTEFRDVRAHDNAGNQLKASGTVIVRDSNIAGNCTALVEEGGLDPADACRAQGNSVSLHVSPHANAQIEANTITGTGDCLIDVGCAEGRCVDSRVQIAGNILHGTPRKNSTGRLPCAAWADENLRGAVLVFDGNRVDHTRGAPCPEGFSHCTSHE